MLSYLKLGLNSVCLVLLPFTYAFGQVLRLDNGLLTVNNLSFIYVDGSVESNLSSVFQVNGNDNNEDGVVTVNGNFFNNADFQLNGKLKLYGNWFNNGNFQSSTGHLFLEGQNQELGGSQVSNFHHLTLNGSGYKFQSNHQTCSGVLNLNSLELRTETFQFTVQNPSVNAIQRTEISPISGGMVSSLNGGFLNRATNSSGLYLFPVGSTVPTYRYRPVLIQPSNTATTVNNVRFAPVDATSESYSLSQTLEPYCELNANYYHQIGSTSNVPITFSIGTLSNEDGVWHGLSRWQQGVGEGWSKISDVTQNNSTPFTFFQKGAWSNFTALPYILHRNAPTASVSGNYFICEGENVTIPINLSGNPPFVVNYSDNQGNIFSQNITSVPASLTQNPTSSTTYTINSVQDASCTNDELDLIQANVSVTPLPTINVNVTSISGFAPMEVEFQNQSSPTTNVNWDFGNGQSSTAFSPTIIYSEEGTYEVVLVAENQGCFSQQNWFITVNQSPLEIFVPNVFTVNEDGVNEFWGVEVKGAKSSEVLIVNRWGNVMKQMTQINQKWDGIVNGRKATDGVYFYRYRIIDLNNKEHTGHGHFTLISN